ncbi:putative lipid II flippase FtsW [Bacillus paralicheniformis]|uniref:putative lipid II flippase FtsW n=1 Tax=Bacillus paralicheniformis TaxID=1648923 RepID=UPI0009B1575D|nr:putative lipid II flippase FtsW [Bacillus paralicheniformis]ARA84590.1 putative lipid II flippase FtsW [Bacillus paralicheniformis]KAA0834286.1 putative lipid II flippase FtsW [Bacillus paralicheniformis]KAA0837442.1 putative lipid II flippase FtsW [Bacillus paralicheniformis]MEC1869563.1 putative lipid II flippase FtsW [Bacillus paralicheniformis]MED1129228.1 putative lipid II flippase FtsW [Bacillus paralicheniformis]
MKVRKMILSHLKKLDYVLIASVLFLSSFGLLMVYSAGYPLGYMKYHDGSYFFMKQLQWLLIGLTFFSAAVFFPYKAYSKLIRFLVKLSFLLLILVLLPGIGMEKNNSQRWIQLGSLMIQPSEAVKLVMVIYFAYVYAKKQRYIADFGKGVMPPLIILAAVFFLILKQPDLGTAVSILLSCGAVLLCAGLRIRHLLLLGTMAGAGIAYFAMTASYRLKRLTSFSDPFQNENGDGYQLINSYLAIDSGGVWGNGLGNSVQKLGFLPEAHTDFIMAVISEELGGVGLLMIIGAYLLIMLRGVKIAAQIDDPFGKLLAVGITFQIMIQALFNLGAVFGLLPITGIPLPFVSYGGSSLMFMLTSAGILVNLSSHVKRGVKKEGPF